MAARLQLGVSDWIEIVTVTDRILAGHSAIGTTARNYVHLSPDYLRDAVEQIDAFFDELAKHTKVHLRYAGDTQLELPLAA